MIPFPHEVNQSIHLVDSRAALMPETELAHKVNSTDSILTSILSIEVCGRNVTQLTLRTIVTKASSYIK